jgi:hypothetical protein
MAMPAGGDWLYTAFTFLVVTLTWIPFRAHDPQTAAQISAGLLRPTHALLSTHQLLPVYLGTLALFGWHCLNRDISLGQRFARFHPALQTLILGGCLVAMFLCSGGDEHAFIYFQF